MTAEDYKRELILVLEVLKRVVKTNTLPKCLERIDALYVLDRNKKLLERIDQ